MFDLDHAIEGWKRNLRSRGTVSQESLEELEDHLRAEIADRVKTGDTQANAFALATDSLGSVEELAREFDKVAPQAGRRIRFAGWVLYAVSFLLPVYQWGALWTSDHIRGWEAFFMTLDPESGVYGIASGLTNGLMAATLLPRLRRRRLLAPLMAAAGLLNAAWLLLIDPVHDLRAGYYAWWASFFIVGFALWFERRQRERSMTPAPIVS